jgi:pyruvate,orthophosphate dikinase
MPLRRAQFDAGHDGNVLNVGLCSKTIPGLIKKTKNERFVYDAYRRLIMMYSDVVMEKAEGIEPAEGKGIRKILDEKLEAAKKANGCKSDTDLKAAELKKLCEEFKSTVKKVLKKDFPDDPMKQLWGGIGAVFKSWNGKKAVSYRRIEGIPDAWGTAVTVQSMVFGNMGDHSATGVAFTRDPATGANKFYGEWLINAQGEDVVAGIRTPNPLNNATRTNRTSICIRWKSFFEAYKELSAIRDRLEITTRTCLISSSLFRRASLHASVPSRKENRHGGPQHGDGHARRKTHRRIHRSDACRSGSA